MKKTKTGMVSIVGRPNVGKSTMLNKIVGEKVSITSRTPQTTRQQIRGIYNDERGQIVFIDTPGVHRGRDRLDNFMNKSAIGGMDDVDAIIYVVDTSRVPGDEESIVADKLKHFDGPIIMALNKVDLKTRNVDLYLQFWEKTKGCSIQEMKNFQMIATSSKTEANIDELVGLIFDAIPEGEPLYPTDSISDMPDRMLAAEIIREKVFRQTKQEIPHSVGVVIEEFQPLKRKRLNIQAALFVERSSQKEVLIGKGGQMLKKIGQLAREELEEIFDRKIFLDLFVKAQTDWRDSVPILQDLGYYE